MKEKILYILVTAAITAILGGISGYNLRKPTVVYVETQRTITDTVYVDRPKVEIKWMRAKRDTMWNETTKVVRDTINILPNQVAYVDTILTNSHGTRYGALSVAYYPMPWDRFNIHFKPDSLPVVTVTKFTTPPSKWYNKPLVAAFAGAIVGTAITQTLNR